MTSYQIIERRLCAVVISKPFTIKDHIEVSLIVNNGHYTPPCFVLPTYLHRLLRKIKPVIQIVLSWSFSRWGEGVDSRLRANRHRYYNQQLMSKSSAALSAASTLPVNHNHSGCYRAGRF